MSQPDIAVLYEDNHLLVVVKPEGIPVQADRSNDRDMLTVLKQDLKQRHGKPGNVFLGLVHRLDRPVGGVMVFAKTSKGASRLSAQIRERRFGKVYFAAVEGCPVPERARLVHWLSKDRTANIVRIMPEGDATAQEAILDYEVVERRPHHAIVKIQLLTGRPHQIRVQMAAIGHPLLGDSKYGRNQRDHQLIHLWADSITFEHPTKGETLQMTAPADCRPVWLKQSECAGRHE